MYASHFGLSAEPFSLTPDPDFLYLSPGHAEALAALKVGLLGRRGLILMTGEVGTGKTTLIYALLQALGEGVRTAYVSNTGSGFDNVLRLALADFGVTPASPARIDQLTALHQLLRDCAERDVTATLVVDEAQNLDADAFEQLRLLTNFETFTHKLLQIVLVGQPELEARLRDPALRALTERIAVHCRLMPLGEPESRAYVDYRLLRASGSTRLFDREARACLLAAAKGLPRRINMLCHTALLFAYGRNASRVTREVAELVVRQRASLLQNDPPVVASIAPAVAAPPVRHLRLRPALALATAAALIAMTVAVMRVAARSSVAVRSGDTVVAVAPEAAVAPPVAEAPADAETADAAPPRAVVVASVDSVPEPAPEPASPPIDAEAAMADGGVPTAVSDLPTTEASPRLVRVAPGATLASLTREVYGTADAELIRQVQAANPQVTNVDHILAGDILRFPELPPAHAEGRAP